MHPNNYLHFVEYAIDEATDVLNYSKDQLDGYSIYTTLNSEISELAQEAAKTRVEKLKDDHLLSNASVVVLDKKDSGGRKPVPSFWRRNALLASTVLPEGSGNRGRVPAAGREASDPGRRHAPGWPSGPLSSYPF